MEHHVGRHDPFHCHADSILGIRQMPAALFNRDILARYAFYRHRKSRFDTIGFTTGGAVYSFAPPGTSAPCYSIEKINRNTSKQVDDFL